MSKYSIGAMNQLGDALEKAGFSPGDVTILKQHPGLEKILDLLHGRAEIVLVYQNLLSDVSSTTFTVSAGKFVARDHFKVDISKESALKISSLSIDFQFWFLGKTEDQGGGDITLRIHKLAKASVDTPIIAELGGEAKVETTLAEVFVLMEKQCNREKGVLLTNGCANIFYVRDSKGFLRAVSVRWRDGWSVGASSVTDPNEWNAGYRIFSR